jgi:hypothetical protein
VSTTANEPSWAAGLVVVTAYDDVAPAVAAAVRHAQQHLAATPALAEFVELRFVAVGPRREGQVPGEDGTARVITALANPDEVAPENHFGLVVADERDDDVYALLEACGTALASIALAVRLGGFAVRQTAGLLPPGVTLLDSARELGGGIQRFCEALVHDVAAGRSRGVPPAALLAVRGREQAPEPTLAELAELAPPLKAERLALAQSHVVPSAPPVPSAAPTPAAAAMQSGIVATTFIVLVGDRRPEQRRAWSRGRALLLGLDALLGELSNATELAFMVGIPGARRGGAALRPAGELRRRHVARPPEVGDFGLQLSELTTALTHAMTDHARRGRLITRPSIVLITLEAPPADAVSLKAFDGLRTRAKITWLLLGNSAALLSPSYSKRTTVVLDHPGAVEEVFEQLLADCQPVSEGAMTP